MPSGTMRKPDIGDTVRLTLPPNPSNTLLDDIQPLPRLKLQAVDKDGVKSRHLRDAEKPQELHTGGFPVFEDAVLASYSDRKVALDIASKLKSEVEHFNKVWSHRDAGAPILEFSMAAAEEGFQVCNKFFVDVVHLVGKRCEEQGSLLSAIWRCYGCLLEELLTQVRQDSTDVRARLERLKGQQDVKATELHEEIDSLKLQVRKLQTSGSSPRLSLRKSFMPGDLAELLAEGGLNGGHAAHRRLASVKFLGPHAEADRLGRLSTQEVPDATAHVPYGRDNSAVSLGPTTRLSSLTASLPVGNGRASVVAGNVLRHLQAAEENAREDEYSDAENIAAKNNALRKQLEDCKNELFDVYNQVAKLEAVADEVIVLESRLEAALEERNMAVEKARVFTPRPEPSFSNIGSPLSSEAAMLLGGMISEYRNWPSHELASMLIGALVDGQSLMASASDLFACLQVSVLDGQISRASVLKALQDGTLKLLSSFMTQQQMAWLEKNLEAFRADQEVLATFVTGISPSGFKLAEQHYSCLALIQPGLSINEVSKAISIATVPTVDRVASLEEEIRALKAELKSFQDAAAQQVELEQRALRNKQLREEESKFEKPHPLEVYLDMLAASDEASLKEGFIGMGTAADVPKLFRCNGKVRNKQMSKRETEKMVKEIWRDKTAETKAGKQTEMGEFIFQHLQKRLGIVTAVIEAGYNLLYSVWKYSFDADCSLFLKVLKGDLKEDVYMQQINLQGELDQLFALLDRSVHPVETGTIPKSDISTALESYFRVGEAGGKSRERFDALMQAMDADQEGPIVSYKSLFEEDREFNQGEFAETVREQFLAERVEYFKELQKLLYVESLNEDSATKQMLVAALCKVDPEMGEKQAWTKANEAFAPGAERHSIKLLMKRLQAGAVTRDRSSSAALSFSSVKPGKTLRQNPPGTLSRQKLKVSSAIQDAVDAVRLKATGIRGAKLGGMFDVTSQEGGHGGVEESGSSHSAPTLREMANTKKGPSPLGHQRL